MVLVEKKKCGRVACVREIQVVEDDSDSDDDEDNHHDPRSLTIGNLKAATFWLRQSNDEGDLLVEVIDNDDGKTCSYNQICSGEI